MVFLLYLNLLGLAQSVLTSLVEEGVGGGLVLGYNRLGILALEDLGKGRSVLIDYDAAESRGPF